MMCPFPFPLITARGIRGTAVGHPLPQHPASRVQIHTVIWFFYRNGLVYVYLVVYLQITSIRACMYRLS